MSVRKNSSVSPPVQVQNQFGQPHGHQPYPFFGGQVSGQEEGIRVQPLSYNQAAAQLQQHQQYGSGFSGGAPDLKSHIQQQHQQHAQQHAQASAQGMPSQVIYPPQRPPTSGYMSVTQQRPANMRGQQPQRIMSTSPSQSTTYMPVTGMYPLPGTFSGQQVIIQQAPAPPMHVAPGPQNAYNPRMPYTYAASPNMMYTAQQFSNQSTQQNPGVYYPSQPMTMQQQPQRPLTPNQSGPSQPYQKRERKMLSIVDPNTGHNVTEELAASQKQPTPPVSGSNSARATPQGTTPPPQPAPFNEVAAEFAAKVASVALDKPKADHQPQQPSAHATPFVPQQAHHTPQAAPHTNNTDGTSASEPTAQPVIDSSSSSHVAPAHMAHPHTHHSHHEHSSQLQQRHSSAEPPQHGGDVRASSEPPMAIATASEPALTAVKEPAAAAKPPATPQTPVAAVTVSITSPSPIAGPKKGPTPPKQEDKRESPPRQEEKKSSPPKQEDKRPSPPKQEDKRPLPKQEVKEATPPPKQPTPPERKVPEKKEASPAPAAAAAAPTATPAPAAAASVPKKIEGDPERRVASKSKQSAKNKKKQKMRNLKEKGDSQGTDMDAFTDESATAAGTIEKAAAATPATPAQPEVNGLAASPEPPAPSAQATPTPAPAPAAAPVTVPAPAPAVNAWGPKKEASPPAPAAQEPTPVPKEASAAAPTTPVATETKCDSSAAAPEPAKAKPAPSQDSKAEPAKPREASKDRKDLSNDSKVLDHRQSAAKEVKLNSAQDSSNESATPARTSKESSPEAPSKKPEEITKPQNPRVAALNEKNSESDMKQAAEPEAADDASEADESVIDEEETSPRPKLNYGADQWSPNNPEGKKSYDRSFLLQLQFMNDSVHKPPNLPDLPDCIMDKPLMPMGGPMSDGNFLAPRVPNPVPDFTPRYMKSGSIDRRGGGGGSQSMGGRSRSSQKNRDDGRSSHGSKSGQKVINLTLNLGGADVKLNKAESAWKPGVTAKEPAKDGAEGDEEKKTAAVFKKVRSILNKLTPQKFDTLLKQIRELEIDNTERLKGSIDLIFEKAIDEPSFAVAYSRLCHELVNMKVGDQSEATKEGSFRWVLLQRCQQEFTKDKKNDEELARRKLEVEAAPEADKKKMEAELNLAIAKAKRRSVGNIRFIGELFKLNMLTIKIIFECVNKLMIIDEDSLECLCRLFTTIGKDLDAKALQADKAPSQAKAPGPKNPATTRVDSYYVSLEKLAENRKQISSRIRFMIQDVLDLRKANWVARRDDNNPKTIAEIHKEAQQEDQQKAAMAAAYELNKQQGGGGGGRGPPPPRMARGFGNPNQSDDGWQMATSGKNSRNLNSFEADKMKLSNRPQTEPEAIVLGPGPRSWTMGAGRGASLTKSSSNEGQRGPANRFAALNRAQGQDDGYDNRGGRSMSGQALNKGRLLTPNRAGKNMGRLSQEQDRDAAISAARNMMGGGSRGGSRNSSPMGSRNQSRESSLNRNLHRPGAPRSREGSRDRVRDSTPTAAPPAAELSREVVEKKSKAMLEEFLSISDLKEAIDCVKELKSPSMHYALVSVCAMEVIEKKPETRRKTGELHYELIRNKVISMDAYVKGMADLLEFAEDMVVDIPKFYVYVGELIGPLIQESGAVPMASLKDIVAPLKNLEGGVNKAGVGAAEVLKEAVARLGAENVEQQWLASELTWADFLPKDENVEEFVKKHKLDFTIHSSGLSADTIKNELDRLIVTEKRDNAFIIKWVEDHVGMEKATESSFIRALTTSICCSALIEKKTKVDEKRLAGCTVLFTKFLDNQMERELQALYALQALMHRMEHPSGLLKAFFDTLYDEDVISEDSFHRWNTSKEPAEMAGSGAAKTSVQHFFKWLNEAEDVEDP